MDVKQGESVSYFSDKPINNNINVKVSSRTLPRYGYLWDASLKITKLRSSPVLPECKKKVSFYVFLTPDLKVRIHVVHSK